MIQNIDKIAEKKLRRAVGLMSGTSVDGIDAALVEISGDNTNPHVKLCAFENRPFPDPVRKQIFELFSPSTSTVDKIGYMNFLLGELYAEAALSVIKRAGFTPQEIDCIGSHGQTIYHSPKPCDKDGYPVAYTVQIGEGAVIAARTGILCVSDFRPADMAVGGQGAPLVPFTEYLLYRRENQTVLLQNLGGIGNITVLPANCSAKDVFAFDTGPGNMIIDGLVAKLYDGVKTMDVGGEIAKTGNVIKPMLEMLQRESYFSAPPPKSTGRELFGEGYVNRAADYMAIHQIAKQDGIATATFFTAWSIADAYQKYIEPRYHADLLIIGGGGSYNPTLVRMISSEMCRFGVKTCTQEDLGFNSDAKEAVAFALLADCTLAGRANNMPGVTGARCEAVMGKISL